MNNPNIQDDHQLANQLQAEEFENSSQSDVNPPFEFTVFERVEAGFDTSNRESQESIQSKKKSITSSVKYTGPKEVIFVSGWIDIKNVYQNYQEAFYIRIILGIVCLFCLEHNEQDFSPVGMTAGVISFLILFRNLIRLILTRNSHQQIKFISWVEFQLSLGYFLVFLGFSLCFIKYLNIIMLPIFILPYLFINFSLFIFNNKENVYLSQKNYCLIESIQILMITLKLIDPQVMNWNMTLVFFMACAIYMTTLGLLLIVILSCSLFGFLYQNLEKWKIKSLTWMTSYYLFTGLTYIYFVKGVVEFFDDENIITRQRVDSYIKFKSQDTEILKSAIFMMISFNFMFLLMHIMWKNEIKKYLSRIIFKKDLRKEMSFRTFKNSFTFKVVQYSAVFFKRERNEKTEKPEKKKPGKEDWNIL